MDPTAFWTMLLVVATVVLATIALYQLRALSKTSGADFAHKFKQGFFGDEQTRNLFTLIENDWIRFKEAPYPCFEIITPYALRQFKGKPPPRFIKNRIKQTEFTTEEVDDLLLGQFEDLGIYEQAGVIDIEMVYEQSDYYITTAWESDEIQRYIAFCRTPDENAPAEQNTDIYDKFEYIHEKCRSFGRAKLRWTKLMPRSTYWIWKRLWKLAWWLQHLI